MLSCSLDSQFSDTDFGRSYGCLFLARNSREFGLARSLGTDWSSSGLSKTTSPDPECGGGRDCAMGLGGPFVPC
jgi:hypothetical protein